MDSGEWTLECRHCGKTFALELASEDKIIDYARQHPCPHCGVKPVADSDGQEPVGQWHHVIGFRSTKDRIK